MLKNNTQNLKTRTRQGSLGASRGQEHPGWPPRAAKARQEPREAARGYQGPPGATREKDEIVKIDVNTYMKKKR